MTAAGGENTLPAATRTLLLATANRGKLREYRALLRDVPFQLVSLEEQGITIEASETGSSLEENARFKAVYYAGTSGLLTLADDSGLEVDALGGWPGPISARHAGAGATDGDRIRYLLARLANIPERERTARFRCIIALAWPGGGMELFSGECRGIILRMPRGEHGFGYDPVFFLPELGRTMAELTLEEKNRVSHRARAAEKVKKRLKELAVDR